MHQSLIGLIYPFIHSPSLSPPLILPYPPFSSCLSLCVTHWGGGGGMDLRHENTHVNFTVQ